MPFPPVWDRNAREGRAAPVETIRFQSRSARGGPLMALAFACAGMTTVARTVVAADTSGGSTPHEAGGGSTAAVETDADPASYQSVVSARRMPANVPREDITAAASVLSPSDSPRAYEDLGNLLLEVPGANVTRTGGLGSFTALSLRGANPDEVRIYIDGIPLNQAVGGAVDLSTLPLGDVERVEVYRGSTPMAFGQSALGGVVSVSTRTPQHPHASARAGVGSFHTISSDFTAGGTVAGRLRLYAGVHVLRAKGDFPDAPPSVSGGYQPTFRENTDLNQVDGVMRLVLPLLGRRELRAGFIGIMRDQGLPAQNIFRSDARAATTRALAHADYESRDDLGVSSRLRATVSASVNSDDFLDRQHQIVGVPTATHDRTRSGGSTLSAEKALGDSARMSALLDARVEDYLPRNDLDPATASGYPAHRLTGTTGVEVDLHSAAMSLDVIPSLRLEASRDVRTGRDPAFATNLPPTAPIERLLPIMRLGWVRRFVASGISVRGNVGRYARIPSFVELYGYNRGVLGSPDLRPEKGVNADAGVALSRTGPWGSLDLAATVFGALVDDLIAWQTYSSWTRAENVTRARIWGLETELRLRLRRLWVTTQATFLDAKDAGDIASRTGRQLAHHPRYRAYARLEWRQRISATAFSVRVYADGDGTAGNFRTTGPFSEIPARLLVGAGVAVEHAASGLRVAASGFNLGDSRVEDLANYPLPGRTLFAVLGWSIPQPTPFAQNL